MKFDLEAHAGGSDARIKQNVRADLEAAVARIVMGSKPASFFPSVLVDALKARFQKRSGNKSLVLLSPTVNLSFQRRISCEPMSTFILYVM